MGCRWSKGRLNWRGVPLTGGGWGRSQPASLWSSWREEEEERWRGCNDGESSGGRGGEVERCVVKAAESPIPLLYFHGQLW